MEKLIVEMIIRIPKSIVIIDENEGAELVELLNNAEQVRAFQKDGANIYFRVAKQSLIVHSGQTPHMFDQDAIGLTDLVLQKRTLELLKKAKIFTLPQLLELSATEVLKIPHIGRKTLYEIKDALALFGLTLKECR